MAAHSLWGTSQTFYHQIRKSYWFLNEIKVQHSYDCGILDKSRLCRGSASQLCALKCHGWEHPWSCAIISATCNSPEGTSVTFWSKDRKLSPTSLPWSVTQATMPHRTSSSFWPLATSAHAFLWTWMGASRLFTRSGVSSERTVTPEGSENWYITHFGKTSFLTRKSFLLQIMKILATISIWLALVGGVMVHFMCQIDWAMGGPDMQANILALSVRVFLGKAGCLSLMRVGPIQSVEELTTTKRLTLTPAGGNFLLPDVELECYFFL